MLGLHCATKLTPPEISISGLDRVRIVFTALPHVCKNLSTGYLIEYRKPIRLIKCFTSNFLHFQAAIGQNQLCHTLCIETNINATMDRFSFMPRGMYERVTSVEAGFYRLLLPAFSSGDYPVHGPTNAPQWVNVSISQMICRFFETAFG
jgi:hypothetical protein